MKRFTTLLMVIMVFCVASANAQAVDEPSVSVNEEEVDTFVYDTKSLDEIPLFIGGDDSLNRFVKSQLMLQKRLNVTGRINLSIIVNPDSTIESIKLAYSTRNLNPYAKNAVIQALKLTDNRWVPGIRNGYYVRSRRVVELDISWH